MTKKRKKISTSQRFRIFARDGFKCQYCGRGVKDEIVLHVDHILPVSKGGDNNDVNLVTSCGTCNLGKSNKPLVKGDGINIKNVNESLKKELEDKKELKKQMNAYYAYIKKLQGFDPAGEFINSTVQKELGFNFTELGLIDFKKLYDRLSIEEFIEAVQITKRRFVETSNNEEEKHKYICGVMHNMYKKKQDPFYEDKWRIKNYYLQNHGRSHSSQYYKSWAIDPLIETFSALGKLNEVYSAVDETFAYSRGNYFEYLVRILREMEEDLVGE